jgi:hypothetical protein
MNTAIAEFWILWAGMEKWKAMCVPENAFCKPMLSRDDSIFKLTAEVSVGGGKFLRQLERERKLLPYYRHPPSRIPKKSAMSKISFP